MGIKDLSASLLCARRFAHDTAPRGEPDETSVQQHGSHYRINKGELLESVLQYCVVGQAARGEYISTRRKVFEERVNELEAAIEESSRRLTFEPLCGVLQEEHMMEEEASPGKLRGLRDALENWYLYVTSGPFTENGTWAKEVRRTFRFDNPPNEPLEEHGYCDLVFKSDDGIIVVEIKDSDNIGEPYRNQARLYAATFDPNAKASIASSKGEHPVHGSGVGDRAMRDHIEHEIRVLRSTEKQEERRVGNPGSHCYGCAVWSCEHYRG